MLMGFLVSTMLALAPHHVGAPPRVEPNDNRVRAGASGKGVRVVRLVVRLARWYPDERNGNFTDVPAFAEEGGAPRIPGPLLRVDAGTLLRVSIRNDLRDSTITLFGLQPRPAADADSLVVPPGESRTVSFPAGTPGTYLYYGRVGGRTSDREGEQLAGALVVDDPSERRPDRVFVINIWGTPVDSATYRNAIAINGRSWPFTERLRIAVGDTVRWRVINASLRGHPMHLHGFYFRVDARGTMWSDSLFAPDQRRLAVTEPLAARTSMLMTWAPDRPGNWLFHCHLGFHVIPRARLSGPASLPADHDAQSHDAGRHMAGLVLGIEVPTPRGWRDPARTDPRRLRLLIQEGTRRGRAPRALGYVLQTSGVPASDSVEIPGSVLWLRRDEPTDVAVINRLREPAAIHWHGIELESYSDGVAGWSGSRHQLAPSIAPNDSFVARLTLPRAGTFIYHTHLNDLEQVTSGLYGALVVVDPATPMDLRTDHLYVVGWDGPEGHVLVNGDSVAPTRPLEWTAGEEHRIRMVNIGVAYIARFSIRRAAPDSGLMTWRIVAKDGADRPRAQVSSRPALQPVSVGETVDAVVALPAGEYALVIILTGNQPPHRRRILVR